MSNLVQLVLISLVLLWMVGWLIGVILPGWMQWQRNLHYRQRALLARGMLYAPIWLPGLLLIGALLPGLFSFFGWLSDHCGVAGFEHTHHLCFAHPPHGANGSWWPLFICGLLAVGGFFMLGFRRVRKLDSAAKSLVQISEKRTHRGHGFHMLDHQSPMAFTLGVFCPAIFLSRGLLEHISSATLTAVLAHEHAHLRRRDNFWSILDGLMSLFLPKKSGQLLMAEIMLAREQACDAMAVGYVGKQCQVEQALVDMFALNIEAVPGTAGMADTVIESRLAYLVTGKAKPKIPLWLLGLTCLFCLWLGAVPVHHGLETIITWLLH